MQNHRHCQIKRKIAVDKEIFFARVELLRSVLDKILKNWKKDEGADIECEAVWNRSVATEGKKHQTTWRI